MEECIAKQKAIRENAARQRRKREREEAVYEYLQNLFSNREAADKSLLFNRNNLLRLPAAQILIDKDDYAETTTKEACAAIKDQFEKEINDIEERIHNEAKQLIASIQTSDTSKASEDDDTGCSTKSPPSKINDAYPLSPTTIFMCITCGTLVPYKFILDHPHTPRDTTLSSNFTFVPQVYTIIEALFASNPSLKATVPAMDPAKQLSRYVCGCCYDVTTAPMDFSDLVSAFDILPSHS